MFRFHRTRRTPTPSHPSQLDRRGFFGLAAGTVLTIGCASESDDPAFPKSPSGTDGGKADGIELDDNGVCLSGPTGDDALGPYWTNNVRQTNMIAPADQVGQRLMLMGKVFARDCITPIPGALVVAWQADDEGLYDYNYAGLNQGSGDGPLALAQTNLRGYVPTSTAGTFSFDTIVPSEYPLNLLDPQNSAYRAPHVHFAVFWADRFQDRHQLVTQMYFTPNDLIKTLVPNIQSLNDDDGGASTAEASRFVAIENGSSSIWHGQFDIVLNVSPSLIA
jgi:protocatechuate 3,4-dioxygenase beta subunit